MTEWLPLVADRPFIMGQMGSFVPPFSPDWTPHGQIHPLPSLSPLPPPSRKPIDGDSGARQGMDEIFANNFGCGFVPLLTEAQ